ncbi:AAA domain-containing protein [Aspergillus crustosus]
MGDAQPEGQLPAVYIIGAQCTGKTTLVHALHDANPQRCPSLPLQFIAEVARKVLQQHHFTRDDIATNPQRALELQQLILAAQFDEENKHSASPILCDRSGVDPIVYAIRYGPEDGRVKLEDAPQCQFFKQKMKRALVIVCPPQQEWLIDDGVRLMASSWEEWEGVHLAFFEVLESNEIPFQVIPNGCLDLQDRVDFVFDLWSGLLSRES